MTSKSFGTVSAEQRRAMGGLAFVQGLVNGTLPLNTIAQTLGYDVAEVDTHPQFETALGRDRIVDRMRGPLHLDSAAQRIDHARKIRQKAVARGADDPPAMPCDQRVDGAAQGAQGLMRACLILPHQAAEADDIRVQDRGEFPLPRAGFEDFSHPPSNDEPKIQG